MSFAPLLKIAPMAWSEVLLLPILILTFYINYKFLERKDEISIPKFIIFNTTLLLLAVLTKYSSIFLIIAFFLFSGYLLCTKSNKYRAYLLSSILSTIFVLIYLAINEYNTGYFMGKRIAPEILNIRASFSNVLFSLNPVFHGLQDSFLGYLVAYSFAGFFIIIWGYIIIKNYHKNQHFIVWALLNASIFLIFTIFSYFKTQIDILNYRLLLGFYSFFFFSVIVSIHQSRKRYAIVLLLTGVFSSFLNFYYLYTKVSL